MARSKYKSHPSFLTVMYHVFIGSLIKIFYRIIKALAVATYKLVVAVAGFVYRAVSCVFTLPWHAVNAVRKSPIISKIRFWMVDQLHVLFYSCAMFTKSIITTIGNMLWWIGHQFALSNLDEIRSLGHKPPTSIGWELYDEFRPRHKLDYWMGDSHITVEIRWWSYNHKYNKLRYIEVDTDRHSSIHSPHGVPHMVSKIHWWEPVCEKTVKPYTPLHALAAMQD